MFKIPKEVSQVGDQLLKKNFQAHLVGGCVRDSLLKIIPADWDIATDAEPQEIQALFPNSVYENNFGTVLVKTESEEPKLHVVEVTTFRKEGRYTDKRRPDNIVFTKKIEDDLARRDFTVNAIALNLDESRIVDPFQGQADLKNKTLRAVGEPEKRFEEDALRLMRAVRLHAQLGFKIEEKTREAIRKNSKHLKEIAPERIRDELTRLIMTSHAARAIEEMEELGLLEYVLPEVREGIGVGQNKHHVFTVFEHNLKSLDYAVKKNFSLEVRLSALMHDTGKPKTKRGEGENSTFYGHQVVGARMTKKALERLRFSQKVVEKVVLLVREHMFVYDPEAVTLKGVRRLLRRTGRENMDALFQLREADRIGSGVPKAQPYRLRHLKAMVEKVQDDPISPKMLKIDGNNIMEILKIDPGPKVGWILSILLEDVIDDPKLNDQKILKKRLEELNNLSDKELKAMSERAKESADEAQERIDKEIKDKYFVK
jgi:tRNA nucleotidyltransferase (CCA-adding enzyme)